MGTHSRYSPSKAHRWLICSGSINAESSYNNTTSKYANEGTTAHNLAEYILNNNKNKSYEDIEKYVKDNRDTIPFNIKREGNTEITNDMFGYILRYIYYILSISEGCDLSIESKVAYDRNDVNIEGTLDCGFVKDTTLHIIDLKYGRTKVNVKDNSQLLIYALGFMENLSYSEMNIGNIELIKIHIVQPRIENGSNCQSIGIEELSKFGDYIKMRAWKTKRKNAKRVAGSKQCKYCLAKNDCSAYKGLLINKFKKLI